MSGLIRLYPRPWRERYEPEFLGLLEARPSSVRDPLDIVPPYGVVRILIGPIVALRGVPFVDDPSPETEA